MVDPIELLCDHVAAEFLVPEDYFLELWKNNPNPATVARFFKVSQIVIARRALDLGLMSKKDFFNFYHNYISGVKLKKEQATGGGDFYLTARKRISVSFANYVDKAVKQERLLYRDAYKITGLKGDTYQNFVSNYLY
ncbi:ImmA/IrrE family metallo-endopeptidase [Pedobacter faecalis]|uniref:ImmA/IrrE family metallo-endopeptidase n=1 Tax=Pedobacter faecalis TaxID=3041495 RepID=UPI00254FDEFD|nr:ImmA/IrrE family metallo-endopeptidase [Pedobacter sp. ELA7]